MFVLHVFHPDSDLGQTLMGPKTDLGHNPLLSTPSSTGLLKAELSYSKPPAAVSAQQVNQHTVPSSTGHSCPLDVTLQVWSPTEIISKDAITT